MKRLLVLFIVFFFSVVLKAQQDSLVEITQSNLVLVTGAGYNRLPVGEIGLGIVSNSTTIDTSKFSMKLQHYLGSEFWFNNNQIIFSPKYTFFIALKDYLPIPLTSGFSFIYSTDFSKKAFGIRLEYGIPIGEGRLFYSFNIPVYNENLIQSYKHQIMFSYSFRIGKAEKYKTYYNKDSDTYYYKDL